MITSPATLQSGPGTYGIYGSGLSAKHGNYVFVQAAGNATALTLNQSSPNSASQFHSSTSGISDNTVNINFTVPTGNTGTPIHIAFTPTNYFAGNNQNGTDINPGALPPGLVRSHGLIFVPISQYDANQYSTFKLPPYDSEDSEATVFTIIARAIEQQYAAAYMIDGFWNGNDDTWPGGGHIVLLDKAIFTNGAGQSFVPGYDNGFPIVAGKTDFAALLKNGPVMIGEAVGQTPRQWLLALSLTRDGRTLIGADTITGKLVKLAYNPVTETLGGITGVFDPKLKGFIALADASGDIPAAALNGLATLEAFAPSTYFAVTIH
jgi:hypothetical protein